MRAGPVVAVGALVAAGALGPTALAQDSQAPFNVRVQVRVIRHDEPLR